MKKSRKIATRLPLFVSTMLLGGALMASAGANDYGALTGKYGVKKANGTWYTDFATWDEAKEYGEDVNVQIMEEGSVLLKNKDDTLPLKKGSSVSLLGNCSYNVVTGGTGSGAGAGIKVDMPKALKNAGFSVNGMAEDFYSTLVSTANISAGMFSSGSGQYVQEDPAVLAPIEDSYRNYKTVIWSISRTGGEGSDLLTNNVPTNKDTTKHYLELNDNELKMVEYLGNLKKTGAIDKVVMLVNTANVLEMDVVEKSDAIDAILWIGQPGPNGLDGVGHILNGTACPSGRTVDIWDADHKKDPTWQNFGDNSQHTYDETTKTYDSESDYATNSVVDKDGAVQTNTHVVEYEEGIYVGYKYYETADAEAKAGNYAGFDYDKAVVYPFGYGLSYTTFDQTIVTTSSEVEAAYKASTKLDDTFKIKVKVTNKGHVAGKEVVQLYNHAPYTKGGIEKAEISLIGFEKTSLLQPGQSEEVEVEVRLADLASFDYTDANKNNYKGYEIEAGAYEIRLQKNSHEVIESLKINLEAKTLDNDDDATNNTPFSNGDDYDSLINTKAEGSQSTMTLMSRSNFTKTFPTAPKQSEKYYGDYVTEVLQNKTYTTSIGSQTAAHRYTGDTNGSDDKTTDPWYKTNADIPSNWTQATSRADKEKTAVQLKEMAGYDYWDDTTIVAEGTYKGKTAKEAWDLFMNQLTYNEMTSLFSGYYQTVGLESAGKDQAADKDGPAQLASGVNFACEVNLASTWNLDFAYERGRVVGNDSLFQNVPGWYGPAMNIHRSAFSGRKFEYYSQDSLLSGKMAAQDVKGYQDKGGYVYIKHFALNDCETDRIGIATFASEQAMREDYLKAFELAVKDGGAKGVMTSFNRIGMVPASGNYQSSQTVLRDEWGFHGQTVTDYYMGTMSRGNMALRAGNELPLGNANWVSNKDLYGTWDPDLRDGKGGVRCGTATDGAEPESPTQYYAVRNAALHIMWVGSSTNVIENGYDKEQFKDQKFTFLQGIQDSKAIALDTDKYGTTNNRFTITKGSLPDGLTFDSATGTFSGTPTKAGSYDLTITLTSDKWVTSTAEITLNVESMIEFSAGSTGDDSVRYEVGLNDNIKLSEKDITQADPVGTTGFTEVKFERIGELPEGLTETIDSETGYPVITGTPTNGSYKIKYKATLTKKTVNGWGSYYKWVTTSYVSTTAEYVVGTPEEETKSIASCEINAAGELVITYTDGSTENLGVVKGADGADGKTGIGVDGNDGTRIESVEKTGTDGLVDIYTITMTDGSTFTFTVTNGAAGAKGDTGAAGAKGDKGDTGAAGAAGEAGKGCGGSVIAASTTVGAVALLAAGLIIKKRREEK